MPAIFSTFKYKLKVCKVFLYTVKIWNVWTFFVILKCIICSVRFNHICNVCQQNSKKNVFTVIQKKNEIKCSTGSQVIATFTINFLRWCIQVVLASENFCIYFFHFILFDTSKLSILNIMAKYEQKILLSLVVLTKYIFQPCSTHSQD